MLGLSCAAKERSATAGCGDVEKQSCLRRYKTPKHLPFRLKRLAVTEEQIEEWSLPTRPTKRSDSRARSFGSLDAIDPRRLRSLVERAIRKHLPKKKYEALMAQEEREREQLRKLVDETDIDEPDEARP